MVSLLFPNTSHCYESILIVESIIIEFRVRLLIWYLLMDGIYYTQRILSALLMYTKPHCGTRFIPALHTAWRWLTFEDYVYRSTTGPPWQHSYRYCCRHHWLRVERGCWRLPSFGQNFLSPCCRCCSQYHK